MAIMYIYPRTTKQDLIFCIRTLTRNSWIHYTDYWIVK